MAPAQLDTLPSVQSLLRHVAVGPPADSESAIDPIDLRLLLVECAAGSEPAFAELYSRTHLQIHGVAMRLLRAADHAVEVVQETYLEVWLKAGLYNPARGSVISWMKMIAHRRSIDRIRSVEASRFRDTRDAELTEAAGAADMTEAVAAKLDTRGIYDALTLLTPIQRQAVVMRYLEDCTIQQIADRLALPNSTVKTRVRDALIRLRERLIAADFLDTVEVPGPSPASLDALDRLDEADVALLVAATGLASADAATWLAQLDVESGGPDPMDIDAYLEKLERTPGVRSLNEDLAVACLRARYAGDNGRLLSRAEVAVQRSRELMARNRTARQERAAIAEERKTVRDRARRDA